jgi:transcriptional regulator with XRE-family HTH domain
MSILSINLIKNRKRLNLSQENIADAVGTSQSSYQEWEKGRSPKSEFYPKLKEVFGLSSIDELFKDLPPPQFHKSLIIR